VGGLPRICPLKARKALTGRGGLAKMRPGIRARRRGCCSASIRDGPAAGRWPTSGRSWSIRDYLAAAAVRQERLSDLLILMRLRERGLRAFISAN
jgi:hypothetical protein